MAFKSKIEATRSNRVETGWVGRGDTIQNGYPKGRPQHYTTPVSCDLAYGLVLHHSVHCLMDPKRLVVLWSPQSTVIWGKLSRCHVERSWKFRQSTVCQFFLLCLSINSVLGVPEHLMYGLWYVLPGIVWLFLSIWNTFLANKIWSFKETNIMA